MVKFEKERKVPRDHATNTSLLLHYVGFGIWNVRSTLYFVMGSIGKLHVQCYFASLCTAGDTSFNFALDVVRRTVSRFLIYFSDLE